MTSLTIESNLKTGIQQEDIAQDWSSRGYNCEMWIDPPGHKGHEKVHNYDELIMPISGVVEISLPQNSWRPAVGEEVFIPAGTPHRLNNLGRTTACLLYGIPQN